MNRGDLERSWDITRRHLARARAELGRVSGVAQYAASEFEDYLNHNELELAMDLLEAAGDGNASTAEFWRALSQAAANMGLHDRADHFFSASGRLPNQPQDPTRPKRRVGQRQRP